MSRWSAVALLLTGALSTPTLESSCNPHPAWSLSDIEYYSHVIYSTPAHPAIHATISFNITNTDMPYTTHCAAHSHQLPSFFYGKETYTCDSSVGLNTSSNDAATFQFSQPDSSLVVNQTWTCGATNIVRTMTAHSLVEFRCKTKEYQNANWKAGETYQSNITTCQPSSLKMTPLQITG
jgi:hypothetical protein